jgi:glycosyltransferase involved in cell wall biosynthesis
MADKVYILSRPLSNTLDEGSKNLVYCFCKASSQNIRVFAENDFSLNLPPNVKTIRLKRNVNSIYVESSRCYSIKFSLLKGVLKFWKYNTLHAFFTLTKINVLVLLFFKFVLRKNVIVNIPAIPNNSLDFITLKLLLKKIDHIIVLSDFSYQKIIRFNKNITKVSPMINPTKYRLEDKKAITAARNKLNIKSSFVIIIPGEYGRLNMNENLIEIIKNVHNSYPEVLFILSFRLKLTDDFYIQEAIKKILVENNVLFINTVPNYHEYALSADIAIFPAKNMDGKFDLPLALIELMAMGKPVLHTDIAPLNELYNSKKDFCLSDGPEIFTQKIIEIIQNKKLYDSLRKKTIQEAETFLPENVIRFYDLIYEKYI